MATTTETLDVDIQTSSAEANLRRLSEHMKVAASNLSSFTNKLDITTKMSTRFGYGIATAMTNIVASVAATMSVDHFAKFDNAMRNVNTLAKLSEKGFGEMRRGVLDLSSEFGKMPQDATAAMKHIVSSGVEMKEGFIAQSDAMRLLRVSSALSVAGQADLDGTTKLMVRTMIAYGKSMADTEHVADVLFQTVNRGIVEFPELTAHLGELMGIAATAKIPLEDLMGVFVAITKQLNPAEAVTAFRTLIMTLSHPPKHMQEEFRKIGIESVAAAVRTKGLVAVMEHIRSMTNGGSLEGLFAHMGMNQKTVKGLATAFSENPEEFRKDIASVKDPRQVQQAHMNAFIEQSKAFGQEMNRFKASLASIGLTIVQQVEPALTRLMKQFNDAAPKVIEWVEANKVLINDLLKVGSAFTGLFAIEMGFITLGSVIGTALRPLSMFLSTLNSITSVMKVPMKMLISSVPLTGKPAMPPVLKEGVMKEWETLTSKQMWHESGREGAKPLTRRETGRLSKIEDLMKANEAVGAPFREWEMKMDKAKHQMSEGAKLSKGSLAKSGSGFARIGESFKSFGKSFSSDFNEGIDGMSLADRAMNNRFTGTRIDSIGRRQYIPSGNRISDTGRMVTGYAPRILPHTSEFRADKGGSALGAGVQVLSGLAANMITPFKGVFDFIEKSLVAVFSPSKWMTMFKGLGGGLLTVLSGSFGSIWALVSGGATAAFTAIGGLAGFLSSTVLAIGVVIATVVGLLVWALVPGKTLGEQFKTCWSWAKGIGIAIWDSLKKGTEWVKDFCSNFSDNMGNLIDWVGRNFGTLMLNLGLGILGLIGNTMANIVILVGMIDITMSTTIAWMADNWDKGWGKVIETGKKWWIKYVDWMSDLMLGAWEFIKNIFTGKGLDKNGLTKYMDTMNTLWDTNYKGKPLKLSIETNLKKAGLEFRGMMEGINFKKLEKFELVKQNNWGATSAEDEFGFGKKRAIVDNPNKAIDDPGTVMDKYTGRKSVEAVMAGSIEAVRFENKTYAGDDAQVAIKTNTAKTAEHLMTIRDRNERLVDIMQDISSVIRDKGYGAVTAI